MHRLPYIALISLFFLAITSCRGTQDRPGRVSAQPRLSKTAQAVVDLLEEDSVTQWTPDDPKGSMPDLGCERIKINHIGRYDEVFNDSNRHHWDACAHIRIEPLSETRHHWHIGRPMVKIASCSDYYVEDMRHSAPYLVPEAAEMLHEIGHRFRDTLQARGGGDYRIKITSALRTRSHINRLRRVNGNSVDSSAHLLGTTVDISYARFVCDDSMAPRRTADDLKGVLAEILRDMREEGWCKIKYERKQPCFHITCCKKR